MRAKRILTFSLLSLLAYSYGVATAELALRKGEAIKILYIIKNKY